MTRTNRLILALAGIVALAALPAGAELISRNDIRSVFAGKAGIDSVLIPRSRLYGEPTGSGVDAYNNSGGALARDVAVRITGRQTLADGQVVPTIAAATNAGATAERTRASYFTTEAIANNASGTVATHGMSANPGPIDLAAATVGDPIYLTAAGAPVLARPTGANMVQEVGIVMVVASDQFFWNITQSENEVHTHADQSEGNQLTPSVMFADDAFTETDVSAAGAGGKFAASVITEVGVDHLFGDDSWNAEDFVVGAGGIVDADVFDEANVDHLFADNAINAEDFAGGAGGIFDVDCIADAAAWQNLGAANSITTAVLAELINDDAFSATEFSTVGAGGKFAADALTEAGVDHLFADNAINAEDFAAGAGGIFDVDCIADAAAWQNLGAADSWTNAVVLELVQDGALTDADATRLLAAEGIWNADHLGLPVRNNSGAGFNIGDVVAINGWDEANAINTIGLADNNGAALRGPLYVLRSALATATSGRAYKTHRMTAANTAASVVGDPVYLSAVGTTTNTWTLAAPAIAGSRSVSVGRVAVVDAAAGVIEFNLADPQDFLYGNLDLQPGILSADATGRALTVDDYYTTAELVAGAGGKFAPGAFDEVGVDNVFADDALNAEDFVVGAGGIVDANVFDEANVDHLFADDAIDAEDFVAGAGGIFAPSCIDATAAANIFAVDAFPEAGVDVVFADDSWNAEDFVVGAGGIVDANVFDEPNVDHLFGDDSINAEDFAAGAGGIFAPNALDAGGVTNLIAADAFTNANLLQVVQDGAYVADAPTRALYAAGFVNRGLIADDAVASDQMDVSVVNVQEGTLSSAQLLALMGTPIQLVAAPGAGNVILFHQGLFYYDFGGVAYTITAGGDDLAIRYTGGAGNIVSLTVDTAGLLDAGADVVKRVGPTAADVVLGPNQPLMADNIGVNEWTLGTGVLRYSIYYSVQDTGF